MQDTLTREQALAEYLECDLDEIGHVNYAERFLTYGNQEWMVVDDQEADERTADYIEESLWAFVPSFLEGFLPDGVGVEVVEALQPQCEGANAAIRSMVGARFADLVEAAIAADGRGHFLSGYDGEEVELAGGLYAYRTN